MPRDLLAERSAPRDLLAKPKFSGLESGVLGASQGALLNFGDEIGAVLPALVDMFGGVDNFADAYKRHKGGIRAMIEEASQANPKTFMAGEFAGGVVPALIPGGAVMRGANMAQRMGRGVVGGAGVGAASGFGAGEGASDSVNKAIEGAIVGAGVGAAAPVVGAGVGKVAQKVQQMRAPAKAAKAAPASTDELRATTNKFYSNLRNAGISYSPKAFARLVNDIEIDLAKNFKPSLADKAYKFLDDLKADVASGKAPDFDDLNALSIQLGKAARKADDANGPALFSIKDKINDFETNAPLRSGSGMTPQQVNEYRKQARDFAFRKIKSEMVDEAVEKAKTYQSGFESGLRNQFSNILRNPKTRKMLTKAERAAFQSVAKGNVGRNSLEILGKFGLDPTAGGSTRSMLGIGSGATGLNAAFLGEPVTATIGMGLTAAGTAARPLARRGVRRAADNAAGLVRAGDDALQKVQSNAAAKANRKALEQAAIAGQLSGSNTYQARQPLTLNVAKPTNIDELARILAGR